MSNRAMFDRICGDCASVDILDLTPEDVRQQAVLWNATEPGEKITEQEINSAIQGLIEYQEEIVKRAQRH